MIAIAQGVSESAYRSGQGIRRVPRCDFAFGLLRISIEFLRRKFRLLVFLIYSLRRDIYMTLRRLVLTVKRRPRIAFGPCASAYGRGLFLASRKEERERRKKKGSWWPSWTITIHLDFVDGEALLVRLPSSKT